MSGDRAEQARTRPSLGAPAAGKAVNETRLARGLLTLAERSEPSFLGYPLTFMVVGLGSGEARRAPLLFAAGLVALLVLSLVRWRLVRVAPRRVPSNPRGWRWRFRASIYFSVLILAAQCLWILARQGLGVEGFLVLLAMAAVASLSLYVYAPDLRLYVMVVLTFLVPTSLVLLFVIGTPLASWLALGAFFYAAVLGLGARVVSRQHWRGMDALLELERQTADLEEARHLLSQARSDLEKRVEQRTTELRNVNDKLAEDLLERQRIEVSLRRRQEDYEHIFEQAHDAILIFDPGNEVILNANQRACQLYGLPRDELIGTSIRDFSLDLEHGERHLQHTLEDGEVHHFETRQSNRAGQVLDLEINASVIEYEGKPAILSMNRDVSERKSAQRWRLAKEAAEATSRAKSEFLAHMSHEIRTPLGGIIGLAELLLRQPLPAEPYRYVETLHSSGEALLRLIDDILDFSKIEAGKLSFEQVPFHLADVVREVIEIIRPQLTSGRVRLDHYIPADLPHSVLGDPARLRQVLINLVGNAVKFTHEGFVQLWVEELRREGEMVRLRFFVRDSGVGIAPEVRDRLFRPFEQGDSSTSRRYGGTGLGLVISRRIVAELGGSISFQSSLGEGTTFQFEIDLALAQEGEETHRWTNAEAADALDPARYRILVVEDNEVNRLVVLRQLAALGYRATAASNGREALERLEREHFDLVLMDCQMPEMDGYEATRLLRRHHGSELPVVAVTAHAMEGDRALCLAAGMDDYLAKPYREEVLARVLGRWLAGNPGEEPVPPAEDPAVEVVWEVSSEDAGAGAHAAAAAPTAATLAPMPPAEDLPAQPLDLTVIEGLHQLGQRSGQDVLRRVSTLFLSRETLGRIENQLAEAMFWERIDQESLAEVRRLAHSLKGSAGILGARPLMRACQGLEDAAEAGDLARCSSLIAGVNREYEAAALAVQQYLEREEEAVG